MTPEQIEAKVQEAEHEQFANHLEHASKIVSQWPEWKQNVLGHIALETAWLMDRLDSQEKSTKDSDTQSE